MLRHTVCAIVGALYLSSGVVVAPNTVDADGQYWQFVDEDLPVGDDCILLTDDMGTEDITDDVVVSIILPQ